VTDSMQSKNIGWHITFFVDNQINKINAMKESTFINWSYPIIGKGRQNSNE
jgi:hypothetical protein